MLILEEWKKWKMLVSQIRGTLCRDPFNKDYSILGSILGSPYFGKLPNIPVLSVDLGAGLSAWGVGSGRRVSLKSGKSRF